MSADTIQLQGVGLVSAIPAEQIQIGMRTCWNFGYTYDVIAIAPKGGQSLLFTLRNTKTGQDWPKVMRKSRPVAAYWPRKK